MPSADRLGLPALRRTCFGITCSREAAVRWMPVEDKSASSIPASPRQSMNRIARSKHDKSRTIRPPRHSF